MQETLHAVKSTAVEPASSLWDELPSFATLEHKEYTWIVPDLIPAEGITMITGDFGSFKSYLSYFLADAIATGTEFINRPCQQHPVLILDRENSHATVSKRNELVGNLRQAKNIKIAGLFTDPPAPDVDNKRLLDLCREHKPVVIIDSLTDFLLPGQKENDPDNMTLLLRLIRELISAGAVAVIVLHHKPKNGSAYRGTTAIPAGVTAAFEADFSDNRILTLTGFKQRDGEKLEIRLKIHFEYITDPFGQRQQLPVTYEVLESGQSADAVEQELQDRIVAYVRDNPKCSIEEVTKTIKKRKADVSAAVKTLIQNGRLRRDGVKAGLEAPNVVVEVFGNF